MVTAGRRARNPNYCSHQNELPQKPIRSWCILSAKYGLLTPGEIISPYEQTLYKMTTAQQKEWALQVYQQFHEIYSEPVLVHILAGQKYRQHLVPLLEEGGHTIQVPMQGLGIGKQLKWFNTQQITASFA